MKLNKNSLIMIAGGMLTALTTGCGASEATSQAAISRFPVPPRLALRADLVSVGAHFRKVTTPNGQHLVVTVDVKNIGNIPTRRLPIAVLGIKNDYNKAPIFGPASRGSIEGDEIRPGEVGKIVMPVALGFVSTCEIVNVHIDAQVDVQLGSNVAANDIKRQAVSDENSPRYCFPDGPVVSDH